LHVGKDKRFQRFLLAIRNNLQTQAARDETAPVARMALI
jgi:hypothetical protein